MKNFSFLKRKIKLLNTRLLYFLVFFIHSNLLISQSEIELNDYVKLIEIQQSKLFSDTTQVLEAKPIFKGYENLLNVLAKQYSSTQFEAILEEAIEGSKIILNSKNDRPIYSLKFNFRNIDFIFHNEDVSRMYMPDTILMDTLIDYSAYIEDRYSGDQIIVVQDTIYNQIDNLNEMSVYGKKLREFFSMLFFKSQ